VSWKSYFPVALCAGRDCGESHYWQERLLHFGLTGAARFYCARARSAPRLR
jgi:hypothetical protein